MGIRDLNSFIKLNARDGLKYVNFDTLSNKKVAIDISIFLYRFKYNNKNMYEHFLNQINRLMVHNITPLYIFDGVPPKEKLDVLIHRKERKLENKNRICELKEKIEVLNNTNDNINKHGSKSLEELVLIQDNNKKIMDLKFQINKLDNKMIHITKEDIKNIKCLLDLLNIKYIVAKGEADLLCSNLYKNNYVDMILSEDMDILVSGGDILLRDFNINNNKISKYDVNVIIDKLNITKSQWINFCILCGCDYVKRIYGIGPKYIMKYIRSGEDIDICIKKMFTSRTRSLDITYEDYMIKFNKAKEIFENNINLIDDTMKDTLIFKNIKETLFDNQLDYITSFLHKNTTFSDLQIKNKIKNIYK